MLAGSDREMPFDAWAATTQKAISHHKTNIETGLSHDQVIARREEHGLNELAKEPGTPLWKLVLVQFDDMLVKAST